MSADLLTREPDFAAIFTAEVEKHTSRTARAIEAAGREMDRIVAESPPSPWQSELPPRMTEEQADEYMQTLIAWANP